MTITTSGTGAWSGPAFLSAGFRPFFFFAAVWTALAMALWALMLAGSLKLPTAFDAVSWHAHEALFGYLSAVVAGFLLTALPNWTGRPPLVGWPLAALLALWLLGRSAIAVSSHLPPPAVAAADLSFLIVLGGVTLGEIVAGRNWRNLIILGLLVLFAAGNALFHWEAARNGDAASGYGLRAGLAAAVMLIAVIGGRIVPAFTGNWLAGRGGGPLPASFGRLDGLALALSLLAMACWAAAPDRPASGALLVAAGVAQAARLGRWRGWRTMSEPLVWILHVGYAFLPAGMLAVGAAILWPGGVSGAAAQHLWMAGAVGVMTLAVMTRASLGHSGRALTAGAGTTALYLAVIAAVLVRLTAAALPEWASFLQGLAAVLWCCAFTGFAVLYAPSLMRAPAQR